MPKFIVTPKPVKPLIVRTADDFVLKSSITGPLEETTLLQRAMLFAETCMVSYLVTEQFQIAAEKLGWEIRQSFDAKHGRAVLLETEADILVLFRGSSESDWEELEQEEQQLAEQNAAIFAETVGKVHHCFKEDVDHLWPLIESELADLRKPIWFTGHSLGAAFAIICANRCLLSYIKNEPAELHTFGAPRVGSKKYVRHVDLKHFRWVNNNDFVTRMPASWKGYHHCGQEMYVDFQGKLRPIGNWERFSNNVRCFLTTKLKGRQRHAQDHAITRYVERIFALYRAENPLPASNSKNSSGL